MNPRDLYSSANAHQLALNKQLSKKRKNENALEDKNLERQPNEKQLMSKGGVNPHDVTEALEKI